jgi:hypothetical protein
MNNYEKEIILAPLRKLRAMIPHKER